MFTKIFKLSLAVFLVVIFFDQQPVFAQLSGSKSIPGDYITIEAAIADLNIQGAGSTGVTFNIAAGHTETFSSDISGHIGATGTSSGPIIFQKSGTGANPVITAGVGIGTMDGIIVISGGDYITFDGIDLSENPANTNDTTRMEWGYALLKRNLTAPIDGCNFITIKNSTITLSNQNTASWGIYAANHTAKSTAGLTLSDSSDVMSYCKFYSNTITGSYNGIRIVSASTAGFFGLHNEIGVDGNNSITGFGGSSATAYGMNLEYQDYLKVANNTVIGGSPSHSTTIYGIRTGSANNGNLDVYGNTVTLTQNNNITYGITNSTGSSGVNNTVNIYNNTIENFSNTTSSTSYTVWLIYNLASPYNLNIYGNTIRGNFKTGTGNMYCIYNSPVTIPTNVKIYNNKVYDNISSGPIHGIFTADANGISIYGNEIYNQTSNLTTTALAATGITIAGTTSSPLTAYVYNNFISDLKAPASASLDAIRGISITGTTANSTRGIYYNTVFLNASSVGVNFGTSGMFHTYAATATSSVLDMRNNIFVNISTPKGTGKTVAFRRSASTNLNNYSELSNNNCFYAGTPGVSNVIYFDGTNFDQTLLDFKTRVVPRETNSISEDVPFVNVTTAPYDLHVKTNIATQIESGGTPITTPIAVTNDFDGDLRNVTTPDIGADEFNGIGSDFTPPSIIYTTLDNTTSTSNRTLTGVDITDQSGVNVVSGTAPRIYFKRSTDNNTFVDNTSSTNGWKYTETSNTSSPFSFEINYSLLFGGTGAQGGDTIQYFVVAQDLANPANIGINQGTFNSTPSSVNLTSAAFPITGDINSYRILVLLSGTMTVGTGGDFPSLTGPGGFFAMINGNFVSGNIVAQIISDLTEPGTNALDQWVEQGAGNYSLTIQPDAAVLRTISGSYTGGLIRLNGADRVTIDGRYNGSGNYLTFENTNAAANTAAIQLISLGAAQGCSNVTIKNCNIKAGSNTLSNIFGIFCGSSGTLGTSNAGGADFANISILGNHISKSRNGIFARGTTASQMTNFIVADNIIGSDNPDEYVLEYGIYNGYADAPQVIGNEIYNMIYDISKWPIYFVANINNAVVSRNNIHSIKQPGTTGYNSTGIYFSSATNCTNNRIDNNMIYDLSTYGNTSMYLYGIRIAGGSNYKIYYNSVSINDTLGNQNANLPSACLYISAAATNIDIRNNIFVNTRVGNSPKNYAVHSPATTTFQFIDYNDYWTTEGILGYFGGDVATLTDWKVVTSQDANSISEDPHFISNMDLHINPSFSVVCDMGTPIAEVTVDFDGDVRSTTTPDIGADEYDCGANTFPLSVDVNDGWNMVSVPGINPNGMGVGDWWTGKVGDVYRYSGGYQSVTTTVPGIGYWMKNNGAQTYNTGDEWPSGGIQIVSHDPIPASSGWNMIGGYENSATSSLVTTVPPGLKSGFIYKYSGGYQAAATIDPGYGYWIKLTGSGQIIIPNSLAKGEQVKEMFPSDWGKLIVTDASGISYTLYSVNGEVDLNQYELPPLPPAGMFDMRYSSDRIAEDLSSSVQTIEMQGVTYPLTVRVDNMDIRLMDETGKLLNQNLKKGEEIVISNSSIQKLLVSSQLIPTVYSLEQNYPNPFNPSTVIEFSLPEDVNDVRLTIYDVIGQKVAELVNGKLDAGKYKYTWNASNAATGMYIYELRTEKFVSVKKMLLMK